MSASPASLKEKTSSNEDIGNKRDITERVDGRRSDEIIIAFCGPVGCNLNDVIRTIRAQFDEYGYTTELIKISEIIKSHFSEHGLPEGGEGENLDALKGSKRYLALQDLGNYLRNKYDPKILAALAMAKVAATRQIHQDKTGATKPPKTVYFIDQLKHPSEVELFKLVYGNIFYLVGVLSPQSVRFNYLTRVEQIPGHEAQYLIDRDRNELREKFGQKLEKTVQLADFFIRNNQDNISNLHNPCQRFVALVHGRNGITPTADESGMYAAYSASLKSACLSRQVGAAIANKDGNVISLGWNDVPKFGGGLYTADSVNDQRCIYHGRKCYNDIHKSRLIQDIVNIVSSKVSVPPEVQDELSELIQKETRAGSIIEFSRAIHAEMEAILGLARSSGGSTDSCVLYTTTFPCHNCARHIIAAGIRRVVYIEPYEKSLALDLHEDAISTDENVANKTLFETFSGVSPRKYAAFFLAKGSRKDDSGEATDLIKTDARHIGVEYLDPYQRIEDKVVEDIMLKLTTPPKVGGGISDASESTVHSLPPAQPVPPLPSPTTAPPTPPPSPVPPTSGPGSAA